MSDAFPPPPPSEPESGGASTPSGSSTPGGYPPPGGTGGPAMPGNEGGYPPASGPGDYSASAAPGGQPAYSNPSDIPGPPPQAAPPPRPANTSMSSDQMKVAFQNANRLDLGIIAAGIFAFIFSLFPYYTVSVKGLGGLGGGSISAWHGFFGWFAVLLALAGAVIVVLPLLGVRLGIPTRLAALGAFAVATLFTLLALFVDPANGGGLVNIGRGFGYWATFVMIIAGLVLCVMRKDAVD